MTLKGRKHSSNFLQPPRPGLYYPSKIYPPPVHVKVSMSSKQKRFAFAFKRYANFFRLKFREKIATQLVGKIIQIPDSNID